MSIKLIIDSAADISKEEADKLGITLIPMRVRFNQEEYLDGVNLTPEMFYNKLVESSELPKTSQITPFEFEQEFDKVVKNGGKNEI